MQANFGGNAEAAITAYDKDNIEIGSVSQAVETLSNQPGLLVPIGARSSRPISKLIVKLNFASDFPNDFAIGTLYFDPGMLSEDELRIT